MKVGWARAWFVSAQDSLQVRFWFSQIAHSNFKDERRRELRWPRAPLNDSVSDSTKQPAEDCIRRSLAAGKYREAFERLFQLYSTKIFHLAFSMLRNETQAEDITQEVLVRIWKALPNYHAGASLSTWIYTIARNTCLTELKKRSARPTISLQEPAFEACLETLPTFQTPAPEAGANIDVNEILNRLPDKYRQALTLFYLEQKSYEELSALLGIPLGTVKTLLFRGKKELLRLSTRSSHAGILELK
jgi:RNA polymerase sigma-70 factor (ECF subfamily)